MKRDGFSLLELSLVLGISGLMLGFVLQAQQTSGGQDCYAPTRIQLADINGAIQRFARANDRLPRPAARTAGVESTTYGREITVAQMSDGTIETAGTSSWGAVPFQALGLTNSYSNDCWGNKFTYVVTTTLTTSASSGGYLDTTVPGTITLKRTAGGAPADIINTTTAYAIISHSEDGLGAVKANYGGAAHGWCSTPTPTLKQINCSANAATVASGTFNNGKDAGTHYFDDLIVANGKPGIDNDTTNLYCWGNDSAGSGALAKGITGMANSANRPQRAKGVLQFTSIVGAANNGNNTGCGLTSDGTAYCWGDNTYGTVGDGTSGNRRGQPVAVNTSVKFASLWPTGYNNMCGLTSDGTAYCWGQNQYSVLGDGTGTMRTSPVALSTSAKFVNIYGGNQATCALSTTEQVYCWGNSNNGMGRGIFPSTPYVPVAIPTRRFTELTLATNNLTWCAITTASDPVGAGKYYCWNNVVTPVSSPFTITGITKAAEALVTTSAPHGLSTGDYVYIDEVEGMTQINNNFSYGSIGGYVVRTIPSDTTFTLWSVNSTSWGAYTGGGRIKILNYGIPKDMSPPGTATKLFPNYVQTSDGNTWMRGSNEIAAYGSGGVQGVAWYRKDGGTNHLITAISPTSPAVVTTTAAHGYTDGTRVFISAGTGMTALNDRPYIVRNPTPMTFELYEARGGATYGTAVDASVLPAYTGSAYAVPFPTIDELYHRCCSGRETFSTGGYTWATQLGGPYNFVQMASMNPLTMGLTPANQLYVWGLSWMYGCMTPGLSYCGMGDGTTNSRASPVLASVPVGVTPKTIMNTNASACFLSTDDYLYCWGSRLANGGAPVWGDDNGRTAPTAAVAPQGATDPLKFSQVVSLSSTVRCGLAIAPP